VKLLAAKLKRYHLFLLTVGLLLTAACLVSVNRSKEPSYQGKSLSRWLDELPDLVLSEFNADAQIPAREALQHIGTNAIPFLLERIQAKDSTLKRKLIEWAERHDVSALRFKRAELRREEAAVGLRLLGPRALPAVPVLVSLLQSRQIGPFAAFALAGITNASQERTTRELLENYSSDRNFRTNNSRKPSPSPNPYE